MADEAYRAVFLRVHPTGKMVLSLTTEPDGEEARYAQLVGERARRPRARRQGRPGRHRPVRRRPRLQHEPVAGDTGGDPERRRKDPRQGAAARRPPRSIPPPDTVQWGNGAFVSSADPDQPKTIADIALYAHGTGALPPGVEGGLDAQTVFREA